MYSAVTCHIFPYQRAGVLERLESFWKVPIRDLGDCSGKERAHAANFSEDWFLVPGSSSHPVFPVPNTRGVAIELIPRDVEMVQARLDRDRQRLIQGQPPSMLLLDIIPPGWSDTLAVQVNHWYALKLFRGEKYNDEREIVQAFYLFGVAYDQLPAQWRGSC